VGVSAGERRLVGRALAAGGLLAILGLAAPSRSVARAATESPAERFREANEQARAGDYPKARAGYAALAARGVESASLYWNWAQAASASGAHGEALWALLRARELDPGDRAVAREVERLREALNLDPAEIAPEPLTSAARLARRYRLAPSALTLLALSLLAHAAARWLGFGGRARRAGAAFLVLGLLAAGGVLAGAFARPTAAVVRRGAPLFDAASPTAEATGSLREGEVVPVLEVSGEWLRVEDNAGARGWARGSDVRRLDRAPHVAD
jgi:hypothetical protein